MPFRIGSFKLEAYKMVDGHPDWDVEFTATVSVLRNDVHVMASKAVAAYEAEPLESGYAYDCWSLSDVDDTEVWVRNNEDKDDVTVYHTWYDSNGQALTTTGRTLRPGQLFRDSARAAVTLPQSARTTREQRQEILEVHAGDEAKWRRALKKRP